MRRLHMSRWLPAVVLLSTVGTLARAEGFAIQSFDGTGQLTFNEISTATVYRVEWAPTPSGPWTNTWNALAAIQATGSGIVTCSVPMCYRVVATLTNVTTSVPPGMVAIPAGTNSGIDPDFGAYSLTVETFFMDATEVTKAKWDTVFAWAVMNGYMFDNAGSAKASNHPVQTVSWYDCVKWCNARSQKEGKTPCYNLSDWSCDFSANGYRLPTTTEWEYAARGGLIGKRFPWGNIIDHTRANYYGNPSAYTYDQGYAGRDTRYDYSPSPMTSPVGAFAANWYGLYDMSGNVREWCNDASGSSRHFRGGCWYDDAQFVRCRVSDGFSPDGAYDCFGFRTVCR